MTIEPPVDSQKKTETTPRYLGPSRDQRTNRWMVTCPVCGFSHEPNTTMCRVQDLVCPKSSCKASLIANYNAEPPYVRLVQD